MTHISTEPQFRRALVTTVVVVALLCAGFFALTYFQGPKLASGQLGGLGQASGSGEQLRLFANQPVAKIRNGQIKVTPATGFSVTTSGDVIAVQFEHPLKYDTRYAVTVNAVTSAFRNQPSTFHFGFTTSAPTIFYLHRGDTSDDITETGLHGNAHRVVYSVPGIQEFTVVGKLLAVVTLNDDKTSSLSLVDVANRRVENVPLPVDGTIVNLRASASGRILGFVFSSLDPEPFRQYDQVLMTIDLQKGRDLVPVTSLSGDAMPVLQWLFVPGSERLIARGGDQSVLLVDPTQKGMATPLGQFDGIGPISQDGKTLSVADSFGSLVLKIATLDQKRIEPSPLNGRAVFGGEVAIVPGGLIQHVVIFNSATGRFTDHLVFDNGSTSRLVFETVDNVGSIDDFSVSPNNQYVAVEFEPNVVESVSDGYFLDSRPRSITTAIVDIATGAIVRSFEGFSLNW